MKTAEQEACDYAQEWQCAVCYKQTYANCKDRGRGCLAASVRYTAFLAGAEWADEWIPVEDELPEENVCVLLKVADELDNEAIYLGSREGDEYMTDGGLVFGTDFDNVSMPDMNVKVVGWRPIEHK